MGRVRSAVARANKRLTIQLAAVLLAGATLISSGLGLFRERLFNSAYLPNEVAGTLGYPAGADAYTVAFTIPDFMFFILVSGALSVTFIPVFNQRLGSGNKKSAWELSTSLMNLMAIVTLVASILIMIFAEPLVKYVVGPGLSESSRELAVSMMRVVAVNPFLFAVGTVIASMQQAVGRFAFYALAPTIYNVGIIIGIVWFTNGINLFGWQVFEGGIMGVALGIVLGAIMQLIVSSIGLIGLGFDYRFKIYWKNKGFRKVLSLLPARSADQGMDYVVGIVETNMASRMIEGSVRMYSQAITLHSMPINLIGVAISNAAFPTLTEQVGGGHMELFKSQLRKVFRVIIWIILPVSVVTFFGRGYVANFILNGGNPTIANILGALVVAMLFRSIYHIAARAFYANQDTKTPLYVSIFAVALNIFLAIWFTMSLNLGVYGLAWAQSIVAVIEVTILLVLVGRRIPGVFTPSFMQAVGRMLIASSAMAIVTYITVTLLPLQGGSQSFFTTFPKFALITAISFSFYLWFSHLLRLSEAEPVIRRLGKIVFDRFGLNR